MLISEPGDSVLLTRLPGDSSYQSPNITVFVPDPVWCVVSPDEWVGRKCLSVDCISILLRKKKKKKALGIVCYIK